MLGQRVAAEAFHRAVLGEFQHALEDGSQQTDRHFAAARSYLYGFFSSGTKRPFPPSFQVDHVSHTRKFRPSASFWEAARIAFNPLHKNKFRSFLTLLGIILATATLIAVTALIHGMNVLRRRLHGVGLDLMRRLTDGEHILSLACWGEVRPMLAAGLRFHLA